VWYFHCYCIVGDIYDLSVLKCNTVRYSLEVSTIVTYSFQESLLEHASCFVCLWMWMGTLTWCINNSGSSALRYFDPSYTLHCGKQFCPYVAAKCQWISARFVPSDTKRCTVATFQNCYAMPTFFNLFFIILRFL
jgi:hypothetical protein